MWKKLLYGEKHATFYNKEAPTKTSRERTKSALDTLNVKRLLNWLQPKKKLFPQNSSAESRFQKTDAAPFRLLKV